MVERAGLWRRGLAALVDLLVAQLVLVGVVALLFAVSGGRLTLSNAFYSSCRPVAAAPAGVALPTGFVVTGQSLCTSGVLAPTRTLYVARHEGKPGTGTTSTFAVPTSPDGTATIRELALDWLLYPLFLLLRWSSDRFAGGSLGRRLVRIAVTDAGGTATGTALAGPLARRYSRLVWVYVPGAMVAATGSLVGAATGAAVPALMGLTWVVQNAVAGAAQLVAAMAIYRHQDTFYDAPCGTAVSTRLEVARARDMNPDAVVASGPSPISDLMTALWRAPQSLPWLTFGLAALMVVVYVGETLLPWEPATPTGISVQTLVAWGGMDRELAILLGQPYRLVTAILVHGSLVHLVVNVAALLVAGFLIERGLGSVLFGFIFLAGGLAGSLASVAMNPPQMLAVGASGAVLALFAAAFPLAFLAPAGDSRRWLLAWSVTVCIPALMPGLTLPGTAVVDRADHIGGEIGGLALGFLMALLWRRNVVRHPSWRAGLAAIAGFAGLVVVSVAIGGGLLAPVQAARLIPSAELPITDDDWIKRAPVLAASYPDDPRALLSLAEVEILDRVPDAGRRDLDRALAAELRLAPLDVENFEYVAHLSASLRFSEIGELQSAIEQDSMALTFRQDDVVALRHRGIAEYYSGRSEQALRDLDQAVKRTPVDPYAALWDHIVALRRGETDRRPELQQAIQLGRWPTSVLRFYSDQIDAETLSLSAIALSPETARDQRCEVDFYRGERALLTNDPTAARPLIMAAASECPHSFIEFDAARQELAGHGALPPQ